MRNRYYDPVRGRFIHRDPTGFADGMNMYQYAGSSPVVYGDVLGLEKEKVHVQTNPTGGWDIIGLTTIRLNGIDVLVQLNKPMGAPSWKSSVGSSPVVYGDVLGLEKEGVNVKDPTSRNIRGESYAPMQISSFTTFNTFITEGNIINVYMFFWSSYTAKAYYASLRVGSMNSVGSRLSQSSTARIAELEVEAKSPFKPPAAPNYRPSDGSSSVHSKTMEIEGYFGFDPNRVTDFWVYAR